MAGPKESVSTFWQMLSQYITVDAIEERGRYLGRDHLIFAFGGAVKPSYPCVIMQCRFINCTKTNLVRN